MYHPNHAAETYFGVLDQLNCRLQVLSKIDVLPLNVLALVFVLLENKHVMVEELLQFLIRIVDTELLEAVDLLTGRKSKRRVVEHLQNIHVILSVQV